MNNTAMFASQVKLAKYAKSTAGESSFAAWQGYVARNQISELGVCGLLSDEPLPQLYPLCQIYAL